MELNLEVENIGPIKGAVKIGTIKPGVNLLRAENGWGKTTILRALRSIAGGSGEGLTVHRSSAPEIDEETGATAKITLGAATMKISGGRKPKRAGAESLPKIEGLPDPISTLETADHVKEDGAAFRRRLGATLRWLGIESTRETLLEIAGESTTLRGLWSGSRSDAHDDLIEATQAMRKLAHEQRRTAESGARNAQADVARIEGERDQVAEGGDPKDLIGLVAPEVMAEKLTSANEARLALEVSKRKAEGERERRAKLKPADGVEESLSAAKASLVALSSAISVVISKQEEHRKETEEALAALDAAKTRMSNAESKTRELNEARISARDREHSAKDAVDTWERQRERAKEIEAELAKPIGCPTEEELTEAANKVDLATRALEKSKRGQKMRDVLSRLEIARAASTEAEHGVTYWEKEAAEIWKRLAAVVNTKLASDRIRVNDDRIEAMVDGVGWRDLSDTANVSEGQRADACYSLMLDHRSGEQIIVIENANPISPDRLARIGEMAAAKGIALVMEGIPGRGETGFSLEHYDGAEVPGE
jgi:hypothetical protein